MSQVKIGWVADSHLDYNQYGSPVRRRDFAFGLYAAVVSMIGTAATSVDAIIHTGDLFNSSRPSAESIRALQEIHNYLISYGKFCYVISGNHDYSVPSWMDVLIPNPIGGFKLIDDAPRVSVEGINIKGYASMSRQALLERFAQDDLSDIHILMLHMPIVDFFGFAGSNAVSMSDIPNTFPVIALGDLHIHDLRTRTNQDGSKGLFGYPGSTELCSSAEDPVKKWVALNFEDGKLKSWSSHEFVTRPVVKLEVTDDTTMATAMTALEQTVNMVKANELATPLIFVKFPTNLNGVMDRVQQILAGIEAIVIPQPHYVPIARETSTPAPQRVEGFPELTIVDMLQLQMKPSEDLYDLTMQMINPEADAKIALTNYVEQRLQRRVETGGDASEENSILDKL